MIRHFLMIAIMFILPLSASGLIHHLDVEKDGRDIFKIETFGFDVGGVMEIKLNEFTINHPEGEESISTEKVAPMGFVMRRSDTESAAGADMETTVELNLCPFTSIEPEDILIDISVNDVWKNPIDIKHTFQEEDEAGLYTLLFARCSSIDASKEGESIATDDHTVSFNVDVTFKNKGNGIVGKSTSESSWDYLSAGDRPLPLMYMIFFVLFFIAFLIWLAVLRRDPVEYGTVHKIHYLMAALMLLKCCTLLTESVRYHMISVRGTTGFMSLLYYIFTSMRGIMLFTVILLIGTGWSIMRSFLHDKEKKIVLVVLIAQIINNIAMVVLEETAPGTIEWADWRFAMHMFDLACCCAIILPILWSISYLRSAVETGSKGQIMLAKLKLFRTFYVMVVSYIYFTRIVVYLVEAVVPYHLIWVGPFATEFATLVFYITTGVKFQPALDNPYLSVTQFDNDDIVNDIDGEFGLVDSDDETKGGKSLQLKTRNPVTSSVEV